MFELLIGGLLLFIAAIGSTLIFDKYKNNISSIVNNITKPTYKRSPPQKPPPKSFNDINQEYLANQAKAEKDFLDRASKLPIRKQNQLKSLIRHKIEAREKISIQELQSYLADLIDSKKRRPGPK